MPTVVFDAKGAARVTKEAPNGGALADLCDESEAPIPFSCRSANCGTCRVVLIEGGELLLPPADEELDILDVFAVTPDRHRLACQARVKPGPGLLHVRAVEDDE
jgi:2Fe-2S ferredoxin